MDNVNQDLRTKYGMTAGIVGIISNALLFAGKIAIGLIGNSITIIADAVNNLSDAASSCLTVFGFKLSSRPADKEHPFGHERFEQVSALIISILILIIGVMLGKSSIEKIITPSEITISVYTYVVLLISVILKVGQMIMYGYFAKKADSESLKASGADARNDALATSAVIIATIVMHTTGVNIDGYMGVCVSLFIIVSGAMLLKETVSPLLGERPDPAFVADVRKSITSYEGVLGVHDLVVHNYGSNRSCFITAHIEVDANGDMLKSHDLIDNIERDFGTRGLHLSAHMDPIVTGDETVDKNKARCDAVLKSIDPRLTLHDFRMVIGDTHTNVLFDALVPYDVNVEKDRILLALQAEYASEPTKYFFIVEYDRDYI